MKKAERGDAVRTRRVRSRSSVGGDGTRCGVESLIDPSRADSVVVQVTCLNEGVSVRGDIKGKPLLNTTTRRVTDSSASGLSGIDDFLILRPDASGKSVDESSAE